MTPSRTDRKEALSTLQSLIRIRTALPEGDELDCVKYIDSLFPKGSVQSSILNHGDNRASLKLSVKGEKDYNLALVGHMDTVPLHHKGQWVHGPFAADVDGDNVYGLGATNMKGGLTSMILTALHLVRSPSKPPVNVHFCFSADEEVNGIGAGALLRSGLLDDVDELIIAEPTDMKAGLAEKGSLWLRITVSARGGHSAKPDEAVNALEGFFDVTKQIESLVCDGKHHRLLGENSCVITQLQSGASPNRIPDLAEGTLDARILPSTNHSALLEEILEIPQTMKRTHSEMEIHIEPFNIQAPVGMNRNAPMVQRLQTVVEARGLPWQGAFTPLPTHHALCLFWAFPLSFSAPATLWATRGSMTPSHFHRSAK